MICCVLAGLYQLDSYVYEGGVWLEDLLKPHDGCRPVVSQVLTGLLGTLTFLYVRYGRHYAGLLGARLLVASHVQVN